ncbi:MAG: S9 family peptidase [Opitutaceae bacterium]|nr:S9 family peptidase [Opitutaceae bacterium]
MPTLASGILNALFSLRTLKEVVISPGGREVAWVYSQYNPDRTPAPYSYIEVLDLADGRVRRLTAGEKESRHAERGPQWSPDGKSIAFLSDCRKPKQMQLYVAPGPGQPVRRLTDVAGQLGGLQWSPDGRTLALLHIDGQDEAAGIGAAAARDDGEVGERLRYQRILLVEVATGRSRTISPADRYVYEYDWSPDSRTIACVAAEGSGDNNYWLARLHTISVDDGAVREIYRPELQVAAPRWSPDGRTIFFIQGLMSDQALTGGDIWCVEATGGAARNLTPGRRSSPSWLRWLRRPDRLLFTEWSEGGTAIAELDAATGATRTLWRGDETLGTGAYDLSLAVTPEGSASAVIRCSWDAPPEVWAGPIGEWKRVTNLNGDLRPHWGKVARITWQNDGLNVQGWLLYPRDFDPGQRYPMIVSAHGGPAAQRTPSWPEPGFNLTLMAAEGYFVFFPNPRGSYGQGQAFTQGNVKGFGYGDLDDILTGVDAVLKVAPVDAARLGIGGWSYGGYLTMWAVTQTGRFRAAIAGAGIANWQSYYGQNLIDQWLIPYFGTTVYDDPAVYARSSPINFVKHVTTPTLIVAGERDKACPAAQSYEFWHALKTLGVKTKLVVYKDEGHGLQKPANLEDLCARLIGWFGEHLK